MLKFISTKFKIRIGNIANFFGKYIFSSFNLKTYDFFQTPKLNNSCVTIGMFDGVHLGHQNLISQLVKYTHSYNIQSVVITFSRHPLEILTGTPPPFIMPLEKRLEILEKMGINVCLILDFTLEVSHIHAYTFLQDLVQRIGMVGIVIGKDFRFGYQGQGNLSMLQEYSSQLHYEVKVVEMFQHAQDKISSTNIRRAILEGNIPKANAMLGRPFLLIGQVIPGKQLGRILGFPTANLQLFHGLCPPDGVYAGITKIDDSYLSLISIGTCPTFGQEDLKIEVYLLGYENNLYGQVLETEIYEKIREQKKFNSAEELCQQIKYDCEYIQNHHLKRKLIKKVCTFSP